MKHYKDSQGNVFGFHETQEVPHGLTEISMTEVQQLVLAKTQKEQEKLPYTEKRLAEYPPIGDQLDALWKGGVEAETMKAKIQAIKAKYPKA